MIKCPKCGADNLMNAIFCRNCGDKLDLSKLTAEQQFGDLGNGKKPQSKAAKKMQQIANSLLTLVIVLLLVAVFLPGGGITGNTMSEELTKTAKAMKKAAEAKDYVIGEADLTNFLNANLGYLVDPTTGERVSAGNGDVTARNLSAQITPECVKVVMDCTLYGFIPLSVSANLTFNPVGNPGEITVQEVSGTKIGLIPLPIDACNMMIEKFKQDVDSCAAINDIKKNVSKVILGDGQVTFGIKARAAKKAAKPQNAAPAQAAPAEPAFEF